ncbi:serine O-acetyltransferase [Ruminococcaceae bacterium YRB3002]|nr:serine O-acetyltransferase [Ruminococcaceae bacterium YRB3002]
MSIEKLAFTVLMLWRTILLDILVLIGGSNNRRLLFKDLQRINGLPFKSMRLLRLNYALLTQKSFRAIFYYRYKKNALSLLCRVFIPPQDDIEIHCIKGEIGGGILLYHNMGRVIDLYSCGDNLTVSQGVTIGLGKTNDSGRKSPIIGNNCLLATNSVVFGPIIIGDNVVIGAGSVVNKDVPANCTVVGNPARIIRMNGERVDIPL